MTPPRRLPLFLLLLGFLAGVPEPVATKGKGAAAPLAALAADSLGKLTVDSRAELAVDPLAELAEALLRVEYALRDRPPPPEERGAINRAFDQASLAFFAGQVDVVLDRLDSLVARVEPEAERREAQAREAAATMAALPDRGLLLEGTPSIPWRLVAPDGWEGSSTPLPVVVALHGAGGNEHMFVEAYGAGRLAALAREEGFVVISPLTPAFAQRADALEALLEAAGALGPIQREAVFLLGHSMGAGAAWSATLRDPSRVAAVACVAGACGQRPATPAGPEGGLPGSGEAGSNALPWPPLLVVAGGLDPLAPPARLQPVAEAAFQAGLPVTFRVLEEEGHTLVVGAVLEEVVAWLLSAGTHPVGRAEPPASPRVAGLSGVAGSPPSGGPDGSLPDDPFLPAEGQAGESSLKTSLSRPSPDAPPHSMEPSSRPGVTGTLVVSGGSSLRSWSCEARRILLRPGRGEAVVAAPPGSSAEALVAEAVAALASSGGAPPELLVAVAELDCGGGTINRHMREAMKAQAHPWILFRVQEGERGGETGLRLSGTLEILGQERPFQVETEAGAGGRNGPNGNPAAGVRLHGSTRLDMTAWGVEPPTVLLGTVRVEDEVAVRWDLSLSLEASDG
jgi:predicted esterase